MATRLVPKKPTAKMKLEGYDKLQSSLAETASFARGKQLKMEVYLPAALEVRQAVIAAAPEGQTPPPEGWLRIKEAVYVTAGDDKFTNVLVGMNVKKAPQSRWVEYGTKPRMTKTGHSTGAVKEQPFWRPTMRRMRGPTIQAVTSGFKVQITKPTNFDYGNKPL